MKKTIYIILLIVVAIAGYMFWKKKKTNKGAKIIPINNGSTVAQTVVTKPPQNTDKTYTVKKGDTLSKIAKKQGVSLSALVAANPQIKNINLIYPGQVINIP